MFDVTLLGRNVLYNCYSFQELVVPEVISNTFVKNSPSIQVLEFARSPGMIVFCNNVGLYIRKHIHNTLVLNYFYFGGEEKIFCLSK